jgi:hypothetical protein
MVHASSLILDDLPPLDNGPLRRGREANHIVFGEDVAILAAFGLLNRAFHTLMPRARGGNGGDALTGFGRSGDRLRDLSSFVASRMG